MSIADSGGDPRVPGWRRGARPSPGRRQQHRSGRSIATQVGWAASSGGRDLDDPRRPSNVVRVMSFRTMLVLINGTYVEISLDSLTQAGIIFIMGVAIIITNVLVIATLLNFRGWRNVSLGLVRKIYFLMRAGCYIRNLHYTNKKKCLWIWNNKIDLFRLARPPKFFSSDVRLRGLFQM